MNKVLVFTALLITSITSVRAHALDVILSDDQPVHQLAIESDEAVRIIIEGNAWLSGFIRTDQTVTITGQGSVVLNSDLIIRGISNEGPFSISLIDVSSATTFAPLRVAPNGLGIQFRVSGRTEIFAPISAPIGLVVINTDSTYVGPNVQVSSALINIINDGDFILSSNATLGQSSNTGIVVESKVGNILVDGMVVTSADVKLSSGGTIDLNGSIASQRAEIEGHLVRIRSSQDFGKIGTLKAQRLEINGTAIKADRIDGELSIEGGQIFNFGGVLSAHQVCVIGEFQNFGVVESDIECGLTCDERVAQAQEILNTFVETNRACTIDSDCVLVPGGHDCRGSCSQAISTNAVEDYNAIRSEINGTICLNYVEDGCSFSTPDCFPESAVCGQGGQCFIPVPIFPPF